MKLSLTYSAYREMEQLGTQLLRDVGEAILALAEDPLPNGSAVLEGSGGCFYFPIDRWCILYHIDSQTDALTVLGVVEGAVQTLH